MIAAVRTFASKYSFDDESQQKKTEDGPLYGDQNVSQIFFLARITLIGLVLSV